MRVLLLVLFFSVQISFVLNAEMPGHGVWMRESAYIWWQQTAGGLVDQEGVNNPYEWRLPREWSFEGRTYIGFVHDISISNDVLRPTEGGAYKIISLEKNGGRITYHLKSLRFESAKGTLTIVFTGIDTMYFESYQGNNSFLESMRWAGIDLGQENLLRRVRVTR